MTERVSSYGWQTPQGPESCGYIGPKILSILTGFRAIERVCDLGCGNGALVRALVDAGYQTVGVEADRAGYAIAQRAVPQATFFNLAVEDDPTQITQSEGRFDAVVSTEVIEHLFSPHRLPAFAHGLLKPGGHLIVSTPYHGYWKNLALSMLDKWDYHHTPLWHGGHIKFFSRSTLTKLLRGNGFEPVAFHGAGRLPYLWKSMILVARAI